MPRKPIYRVLALCYKVSQVTTIYRLFPVHPGVILADETEKGGICLYMVDYLFFFPVKIAVIMLIIVKAIPIAFHSEGKPAPISNRPLNVTDTQSITVFIPFVI